MTSRTDRLFKSYNSPTLQLANRLAVAPMTRVTASSDGVPTERMARYYQRFAAGGFGLVITEGNYIDTAASQTYENQPGLANDAQAVGWSGIVDTVHAEGAKMVAQIQHAGALAQGNRFGAKSVAPSAVQPKGEQMQFYRGVGPYPLPRALTESQIADVIASFASTAERAVSVAGFDGVEIHGANGYLLDEFLTDYTNQRTDRWGGSVARRVQLSVEVVKAVRAAVGKDVSVGIRISQGKVNDFHHKWVEKDAAASTIFGRLADTGVDYIHITEFEAWRPAFDDTGPTLVELARRNAPRTPLIANGGLHDLDRALEILDQGADIVAIGRGALANPDWPQRVQRGTTIDEFNRSVLGPIADIKDSELIL
ncbi:NADH:flavin oxidoreductase [Burkholderia sp. KK1]|nr:NADH:flavin oxidoreductase [Burkholderia sp. KK1]